MGAVSPSTEEVVRAAFAAPGAKVAPAANSAPTNINVPPVARTCILSPPMITEP